MSTTVTPSPPQGRAASHRRGSTQGQAHPPPAPRARRGFRLPRASTTPGRLWLARAGLVIGCLAWGVLATLMVVQHTSAARDVAATDESLSLDAQQIYQSLADADVTVSTAYLYGRTGPYADRVRYQHDIAVAAADLKAATAASGNSSIGTSLTTLSTALPVYTGYVEDGQIYNSLGYPAGGSFIEVASEEMHVTMLPAARSVYAQENAQLSRASAQATGLPLAIIVVVGGLAVIVLLFRSQRWLSRRTHRTVNVGLFLASVAAIAALIWLVVALIGGRSDLLQASEHGSGPTQTLAQADISALQARGDETLNLISRTGDANFQHDFHAAQSQLSAELNSAGSQSAAGGAGPVAAAGRAATAWFAVNQRAQQLDATADYGAETQLEIGSGPGTAGTLFGQLESDLSAAINADQGVFASNAAAGSDAFTGLEAGVIVAALVMAIGCGWGLTRRLAEYR
jgi:negative regulator of sigma E activity